MIIGIDFGTTNSVSALSLRHTPIIIPNDKGALFTPSFVTFKKDGTITVGEDAKSRALVEAEKTVFSIKRFMGTDFSFEFRGKRYRPSDISSLIFKKLKEDAKNFLKKEVREAVITVPANFSEIQKDEIKTGAKMAGLCVKRMISEPTAAAIAYGFGKGHKKILVFDIGGGTYDISILETEDGLFEVLATCGDPEFGGDDFDEVIVNFAVEKFKREEGIDLFEDRFALQKLKEEAERVKISLSHKESELFSIPFISADESGPKHIEFELKRWEFEYLITPLLDDMELQIKEAFSICGISPEEIDEILLVGGTTKIPAVRRRVEKIMKRKIKANFDPLRCVAKGAAIFGETISSQNTDFLLLDVVPKNIGVEVEGGYFMPIIVKNTPIPVSKRRIFTSSRPSKGKIFIHIMEGDSRLAKNNVSLCTLCLDNLRCENPMIDLHLLVDEGGVLHIKAKELSQGVEREVLLENFIKR